ncbi:MAG: peptidylprolyl isomerase [Planctomycetota bacterium]|nr:MAG: peptidylprolyl isomerase [Planctomycetota bacterium]
MNIAKNAVALIDYTLTNDAGEVLDTSEGGDPLAYIHGTESLIPGLETQLDGKAAGDELKVHIAPADAYGERDDEAIHSVSRDDMPEGAEIVVGMQLEAESEDGVHLVTVIGVDGDDIHIDANHPLAGVALNFEVKVIEVRDATTEELEHGHVHGEGGHEH